MKVLTKFLESARKQVSKPSKLLNEILTHALRSSVEPNSHMSGLKLFNLPCFHAVGLFLRPTGREGNVPFLSTTRHLGWLLWGPTFAMELRSYFLTKRSDCCFCLGREIKSLLLASYRQFEQNVPVKWDSPVWGVVFALRTRVLSVDSRLRCLL